MAEQILEIKSPDGRVLSVEYYPELLEYHLNTNPPAIIWKVESYNGEFQIGDLCCLSHVCHRILFFEIIDDKLCVLLNNVENPVHIHHISANKTIKERLSTTFKSGWINCTKLEDKKKVENYSQQELSNFYHHQHKFREYAVLLPEVVIWNIKFAHDLLKNKFSGEILEWKPELYTLDHEMWIENNTRNVLTEKTA